MPSPDWERADRFRPRADQAGTERDLAHRLSRLPSSHPSAWPAPDHGDAENREPGEVEWWHPAAHGGQDEGAWEPDDVADEPDDAADEPDDVPPSDDAELDGLADQPGGAGRQLAPARGGRLTGASTGWGELAGPLAHSPYRPWFSAEGAGDPWFAVREAE